MHEWLLGKGSWQADAVQDNTRHLWEQQDRHRGDRLLLFSAVADHVGAEQRVLYPGSYVDIAASFVFDDVVYIDTDDRAARFFSDGPGVDEIVAQHRRRPQPSQWRFLHADYAGELPIADAEFDVLVSLYAGFVSEACTRYLRPNGFLLANPSHGDVALAALDDRYELCAVVISRSGIYSVRDGGLETYLVPKRDTGVTRELVHRAGRGTAYTRSPYAYLFHRLG